MGRLRQSSVSRELERVTMRVHELRQVGRGTPCGTAVPNET